MVLSLAKDDDGLYRARGYDDNIKVRDLIIKPTELKEYIDKKIEPNELAFIRKIAKSLASKTITIKGLQNGKYRQTV